jgi:outer membrane murein-binding lipoprotein Lpp
MEEQPGVVQRIALSREVISMKFMSPSHVPGRPLRNRRRIRYFCLGIVCAVSLIGCVSKSRYESVATEMEGLRGDLARAQAEVQVLEEQRNTLQKLNLDGERLLAAIRTELQQARTGYEEYKAEQSRLESLKAKAKALQNEQQKHVQGMKAAKREELKMQAVIDRYEKDMQQVPDIGDVLRVSKSTDPKDDGTRLVATVTPLTHDHPSSMNASPSKTQSDSSPLPPPHMMTAAISPVPAAAPAQAPTPEAAKPATVAPPAAPAPKPQQAPVEESWIGSLTGWLSSLWGWIFS